MTKYKTSVEEVLQGLNDGDDGPALDWFGEKLKPEAKADLKKLAGKLQWNFNDDPGTSQQDQTDRAQTDPAQIDLAIETLVHRTFSAAITVKYAAPLLMLYLKFICEDAWEVTWSHSPIIHAVKVARHAWSEDAGLKPEPDLAMEPKADGIAPLNVSEAAERVLTRAALQCLTVLYRELVVETAVATASLTQTVRTSTDASDAAMESRIQADHARKEFAGDPDALRILDEIWKCGRREELYYGALESAAQSVQDFFTDGPDLLDHSIRLLQAAEDHDLIDEIDRSELRAHRASLSTLAAARDWDQEWLRVDHGTLVYIYPFGLRDITGSNSPEKLVRTFREKAHEWELAGLKVSRVYNELSLNDIWQGHDPHKRQFAGAAAELPELELPNPDGGDPIRLAVELRLSNLGNHCLRITTDINDATPLDLHAAMLRPSPEFGDLNELKDMSLRVAGGVGKTWGCLADFSDKVISDVAKELAEISGNSDQGQPALSVPHAKPIEHSGRKGEYHVLVSIQRASCQRRGGESRSFDSGLDLKQVLGIESVWHPVRHGVNAIGEWARYPIDSTLTVHCPAFAGDLLVRTANSTLMAILGSPDHMIRAELEAAEFVATLVGLFGAWQQELAAYYVAIQGLLGTAIEELGIEEAQRLLLRLEDQQVKLHKFVMTSRRTLMFVTSPSLVTSPVMRVTLDRLLAAAGFDRLRSEFEGMVKEVLGDRLGTLVDTSVRRRRQLQVEQHDRREDEQRKQQERREDEKTVREAKQRRITDILLAAIAGIGTAGVFQLLQAGFDQDLTYAGAFATATILIGLVIAYVVYRVTGTDRGSV